MSQKDKHTKIGRVTFSNRPIKYYAEISNGLGPYLGLIDMKNR